MQLHAVGLMLEKLPWPTLSSHLRAGKQAGTLLANGNLVSKAEKGIRNAFEKLWNAHIMHGDVHVGNVAVSEDGKHVVLFDFGNSKLDANAEDVQKDKNAVDALISKLEQFLDV